MVKDVASHEVHAGLGLLRSRTLLLLEELERYGIAVNFLLEFVSNL